MRSAVRDFRTTLVGQDFLVHGDLGKAETRRGEEDFGYANTGRRNHGEP